VYGAGAAGSTFLRYLSRVGYDKNKVVVWDIKWKKIGKRYGFLVSEPNFEWINTDENILVVIAFMGSENMPLANKIQQNFIEAGYNNIIFFSDIYDLKIMIEGDFECAAGYADCKYQDDVDFSDMEPPVKAIAFYLPQFHEIPENDEWWGKGFTEWTNVKKARPRYKGHYQPREPHEDLGYYDLSDVEVMRKQAKIARKHGVYGWSMYYYWFSGKTLLAKPIDLLLENKDIDINFCLTWCNHTWTKSWVGDNQQELIRCEYREDDPEKFIDDIKKYMEDERYIKINGKPLITIYFTHEIPNVRDFIGRWRKRALEVGIGEIMVLSIIRPYTLAELGLQDCFDGETEFGSWQYAIHSGRGARLASKSDENVLVATLLTYYSDFLECYKEIINLSDHSAYLCCPGGFDNTPRYKTNSSIHDLEFSIKDYYDMVRFVTEEAISYNKEIMFVFAWNEWAESAYLEPDKRFGYALLNTFSRAINGLPFEN